MCHYILKYNPSQKFRSKKNTLKYISKISKNFVLNDFQISGLWTFLALFAFKRNLQPIRMSVGFSDCRGTFTSVFQTITKLRPYTLLPPASCACMQRKYCNPLTRWPSTRVLKPSPVIALKCTNTVTQGYYVCDSNVQEANTTIKMCDVYGVVMVSVWEQE